MNLVICKEIVVGVIVHEGKILIDRRPLGGAMGGLWELPGGKVEPGETLEQALHREIHEELGITVEVGDSLVTIEHRYPTFELRLTAFNCRYLNGTPLPLASDELRWVKPSELEHFSFPEANYDLFQRIGGFLDSLALLEG